MDETSDMSRRKSPLKLILLLSALAAAITALALLPTGEWLQAATDRVDSLGFWAPLAFIVIYAIAVVFFVPASVLTAASGIIFGVVRGSLYVSIASVAGAALSFLIARFIARSRVEKRIQGNETFAAIDGAVAREGWKIVALTRLSPIFPFALLNYAYGVTRVKFTHYLLASWIGMFPGTVLYVYIGSLGKAASEAESRTTTEWMAYGVGLAATLAVTILVTRIARRALNERIGDTIED
ncbi:MAG: TVP38/TMEM64 family protein [Verrucomicrobiales bacterium]|nr:TVP38/TMEM64 family protein [Verrucomicrobiales bacterium]